MQEEGRIPRMKRRRENTTEEEEVQNIMKKNEMKIGQKEIRPKRGEEQERMDE
jgi:hypothetical protein